MQKFDVNKLRVASPCSVDWETMTGDERVRHCHACQLNIYNTAEMTTQEVEHLIENREGRLCIRMFRRTDGTVLTKDCPVGLRAIRKRAGRLAGAAVGALFGLVALASGQRSDEKCIEQCDLKIERQYKVTEPNSIIGTISDENGAVIAGVELRFVDGKQKLDFKTVTNSDGEFRLLGIPKGAYKLSSKASGFSGLKKALITIGNNEQIALNLILRVNSETVVVGIYADADRPTVDTTESGITHTVYRRKDN